MRKIHFIFILLVLLLTGVKTSWAQQDPSIQIYINGNTYYAQKNYDMALASYLAAVQVNPKLWQAYQGLGNCYYAKGDKASALTAYQNAYNLNPTPALGQFVQSLQAIVAATAPPALPNAASTTAQSTVPQMPAPTAALQMAAPISSPTASRVVAVTTPSHPAASTVDLNLPRQDKIVLEAELNDWVGDWGDLQTFYGDQLSSNSLVFGGKVGVGAAYVLSPNWQLGLKAQFLAKNAQEIDSLGEATVYNERAAGGALEVEGTFPMSDGVNFITSLQLGFYALVSTNATLTGTFNGSASLSDAEPGGMLTAGVELLMNSQKSWALDLSASYQYLNFDNLTDTPSTGGSFSLKNPDGSNANLSFSGFGIDVAARFF